MPPKWIKITAREYGVQYSEMQIRSLTDDVKQYLPYTSYKQIIVPEQNNQCFYIDDHEWNSIIKALHDKYSASLDLLGKFEQLFLELGQKYMDTAMSINKMPLSKLSNKQLVALYREYQQDQLNYSAFNWAGWILNSYIGNQANQILEKYTLKIPKSDVLESQLSLFKPVRTTAIIRLRSKIAKLGKHLKQEDIKQLWQEYQWLACLDIHNKPWTFAEFIENVKLLQQGKTVEPKPIEDVCKQLKITQEDITYFEMVRRFAYIMDARDDFRRQGIYYARAMFSEIATRMALRIEDMSYLQEKEILHFLELSVPIGKGIVEQRKQGFVLYYDVNNQIVCVQGEVIQPVLKSLGLKVDDVTAGVIKGLVASKGKAKGRVAIVKGVEDLEKVKHGDIMIAITTHPDYVPAMQKAKAIVTDEGGITCHAAIVARELKVACIVGTKNATRLLKDGDLIEVDAQNGLVTKLE